MNKTAVDMTGVVRTRIDSLELDSKQEYIPEIRPR